MKTIAVTGANSYLGQVAIKFLREQTPHKVLALVSPRAELTAETDSRIEQLRADLAQPLTSEAASKLAVADQLIHFAWTRVGSREEVSRANLTMIENLLAAMGDASRFCFVSSVSASPSAMSTYGQAKYESAELVRLRGGSVLVCGLVVEPNPPRGPYNMLRKNIARLPFRIRLVRGEPLVFPVRLEDLGAALVKVSNSELSPDTYRMFSPPVRFNAFVAMLEQLAPRIRVTLALPTRMILKSVAWAKKSHIVPTKLCDQILTFLYKDADHLASHAEIPGLTWTPCTDTSFLK